MVAYSRKSSGLCQKQRNKKFSKKSYLVKIIGIVANQMIPVEIYEDFQRLGIFDV